MAREAGVPLLQIHEMSEKDNIPFKFLEQILMQLKAAGYLETRRGAYGGYLLAKRHDSDWDFAVSSLRTSQSSGYSTRWINRPSTSTGVPCVPITCSPITRATTR